MGVNYARSQALSEVGGIAMDEIAQKLPGLPEVISELVMAVEAELEQIGDLAYAVARYRELSAHSLGDVLSFRTAEGIRRGTFSGLDERGFLVLQSERGEVRLSAGEAIEEWTGERNDS
jgi:biotin-(acetyl-CoA carboxylase) ligase